MKTHPFPLFRILAAMAIMLTASCKENRQDDSNVVDDGAAKSEVTQTGQNIGSTTDSTTVISDEPNPSNDWPWHYIKVQDYYVNLFDD